MTTQTQPNTFDLNHLTQAFFKINSTEDYSHFKLDPRNRPVDTAKLQRLIESIRQNNLLAANPIIVAPDGTVIDGQTRLTAAKELGERIYYVVVQGVDDEAIGRLIIQLNTAMEPWKSEDYLHFWCASGHEDYLELRSYMERYPFIRLDTARWLCAKGERQSDVRKKFAKGEYACNNLEHGIRVAEAAKSFAPYFKHYSHSLFMLALSHVLRNPGYDQERMLRKLEHSANKLYKCSDIPSYLSVLNEIYNFRMPQQSYVDLTQRRFRKEVDGE